MSVDQKIFYIDTLRVYKSYNKTRPLSKYNMSGIFQVQSLVIMKHYCEVNINIDDIKHHAKINTAEKFNIRPF